MQQLKLGSVGDDVERWQAFLVGSYPNVRGSLIIDGHFGPITQQVTQRFQKQSGLLPDGVVGNMTVAAAMKQGFGVVTYPDVDTHGPAWPPKPDDVRPLTSAEKFTLFGGFSWSPAPTPTNPEGIAIVGDWVKQNIITVHVPQFARVPGSPKSGNCQMHRLVAPQFLATWAEWDRADLLTTVLTFNGGYNGRLVRGSQATLSSHSMGSAFDINAQWNVMGSTGALLGATGCVRELVEIAFNNGFWWGNWFKNRPDPMHFEVFKLVTG